jgi:hypothetical protein
MKVVPDACVVAPRVTELPSLEVRITDPAFELHWVFTFELAVRLVAAGSVTA